MIRLQRFPGTLKAFLEDVPYTEKVSDFTQTDVSPEGASPEAQSRDKTIEEQVQGPNITEEEDAGSPVCVNVSPDGPRPEGPNITEEEDAGSPVCVNISPDGPRPEGPNITEEENAGSPVCVNISPDGPRPEGPEVGDPDEQSGREGSEDSGLGIVQEDSDVQLDSGQEDALDEEGSLKDDDKSYCPSVSSSMDEDSDDLSGPDVIPGENTDQHSDNDVVPANDELAATGTEDGEIDVDVRNLRLKYRNVTVPTYKKKQEGKRNYCKVDFCRYCSKPFGASISSHYENIHKGESDVQDILLLPLNSLSRKAQWLKLRNQGNYRHNTQVLKEGKGELVVYRRPTHNAKRNYHASDFLPCEFCLGFVLKDSLWSHVKSCLLKPKEKQPEVNYLRNARVMLEPFLKQSVTEEDELEDLFLHMKETTNNPGIPAICKEDLLIREFAKCWLNKLGTHEEQRKNDKANIRTKVRSLGRLLKKLNENNFTWHPFFFFLSGPKFRHVVASVKAIVLDSDSPQLGLTLGHYIKQVALLKVSLGIEREDRTFQKEGEAFKTLYETHWNSQVACVVNRRQKLRQINKAPISPVTDDLIKMKEWLCEELTKAVQNENPSPSEWLDTAQKGLVRLLLFNKRRVGEVEELKVSDFLSRPSKDHVTENREILDSLDVTEKALAHRMDVMEVRGKSTRGIRKVYLVMTEDMVSVLDYLIRTRPHKSLYIFGRATSTPLDGCKAMRMVTAACPGLKNPQAIRTRSLRKYMATTAQVLDMTSGELRMVADHLGHSVNIHTDIYRLQSSLLERTKVAKVLLAVENGMVNRFRGKNLSQIDANELPIPLAYNDAWTEKSGVVEKDAALEEEDVQDDDLSHADVTDDEDVVDAATTLVSSHTQGMPDPPIQTERKRTRWTPEENEAIQASFINPGQPATAASIRTAKRIYPCLDRRSEAQIRTKVHNIVSGKDKFVFK